jgi:hypothetical protein
LKRKYAQAKALLRLHHGQPPTVSRLLYVTGNLSRREFEH